MHQQHLGCEIKKIYMAKSNKGRCLRKRLKSKFGDILFEKPITSKNRKIKEKYLHVLGEEIP